MSSSKANTAIDENSFVVEWKSVAGVFFGVAGHAGRARNAVNSDISLATMGAPQDSLK